MFDKLIENLPKILRALNFLRVIQLAILAILFTLLYASWDARSSIIDGIKVISVGKPSRNVIIASESTVLQVKNLVNRSQIITGVQLINTDFRSNSRTTAFFFADRSDLQTIIDETVYNRVSPTPLFLPTNGDGLTPEQVAFAIQSNSRMIEIISAEFVCFDSKTTTLASLAPAFSDIAPVICSISIPPYAGKFSGYLNIFLLRAPTLSEKSNLRDAARALASDIFDSEMTR